MSSMVKIVLMVYGWGWSFAVLYEEWMYFVEEGFMSWLFFGWFVPLFRALFWPLNVYQALVG